LHCVAVTVKHLMQWSYTVVTAVEQKLGEPRISYLFTSCIRSQRWGPE